MGKGSSRRGAAILRQGVLRKEAQLMPERTSIGLCLHTSDNKSMGGEGEREMGGGERERTRGEKGEGGGKGVLFY